MKLRHEYRGKDMKKTFAQMTYGVLITKLEMKYLLLQKLENY